jgi:tripartite-type tricarboxylate transporter receptor subunit TctC
MQRRHFLSATATTAAAACGFVTTPLTAVAQGLPRGPVRIVVGFPPGGGTDVVARVIAQQLAILWGIPVLVENRAGAAGVIAAGYVAKLPADGSTLLMTNFSNHAVAPSLYPKLDYVIERDFTPIMLVGIVPSILVCRPNQPAQTVQAIIERCRATPGSVSFGSAGPGSVQHLALEMFKLRAGIDALHVPYKGSAPAVAGLLGDEVQVMIGNLPPWSAQIKAGRVQALAVSTAQRHHSLPDVPALAESLPGFETLAWFGVLAPAGTPRAVVERINTLVNQALEQPDIKVRLATLACDPAPSTPEAFASRVSGDVARWKKLATEKNIRAD